MHVDKYESTIRPQSVYPMKLLTGYRSCATASSGHKLMEIAKDSLKCWQIANRTKKHPQLTDISSTQGV